MKRALLLILSVLVGNAMAAGLYKWVDETGRVVYSDIPPPASAKETRRIAGAPPPADPGASKALQATREQLQKDRERDDQTAKKEAEEANRKAENEANCAQWRGELLAIERGTIGSRINEKGERYVLDAKQISRRKADLQRWIADTCPG